MSFLSAKRPYWDKPSIQEAPDPQHPQLRNCIAWYPLLEGTNTNLRDVLRGYSQTNYINPQLISWRGTTAGQGLHFPSNNSGRVDIINPLLTQLPTTTSWHVVVDHMPLAQYVNATVASWRGTDSLLLYSIDTNSQISVYWADIFSKVRATVPDFSGQRGVMAFGSESQTRHVLSLNGETVLERVESNANAGPFADVSFGNWAASNQPFKGTIFQVRFYSRFLEETELRDICERPWAPFERRVWISAEAPGPPGPIILDIDELRHGRLVDDADVIVLATQLVIDALRHDRRVDDIPAVGVSVDLFLSDMRHGRPVDDLEVLASVDLAITSLRHGRYLDVVDLQELVGVIIDIDDARHGRPVDALLLDVEQPILVDGLRHGRPVDTVDVQLLMGDQTGIGATASAWVLDAGQTLNNAALIDFGYHVLEGVFDGNQSVLGVDGSRVTGPAGTRELTALTLGADVDGQRRTQGEIAELRIYAGALSQADRDRITQELTTKWITG